MATIPSREHPSGTVANALLHYYDQQQLPNTVHVVTRLDRDTSGLMLVAKKSLYSPSAFAAASTKKAVHRTYEALVYGVMEQETGTIDAPIARKRRKYY
ncbi:hypothetical protein GCM10020331_078070 [Ectobacillus funiculus]